MVILLGRKDLSEIGSCCWVFLASNTNILGKNSLGLEGFFFFGGVGGDG